MPRPDSPQALTDADVRKVATLARLAIPDDRVPALRAELASILTYIDRLRRLDLSGVDPLTHVGEGANRLDGDRPGPTLSSETLMRLAPDTLPPFLKVPKVLGEGSA
jgi:aspartyl-tRNA(Asn)/glutamyl-tRNA(Gln) amidotransferase subunit C